MKSHRFMDKALSFPNIRCSTSWTAVPTFESLEEYASIMKESNM